MVSEVGVRGCRVTRAAWRALGMLVAVSAAATVHAFAVFPYADAGVTLYSKWGDNHAGTPGGTVTWSIMPPGTLGSSAYCSDACPGVSGTSINMEVSPGGGFAPVTLASLQADITAMLAQWSAVTGIHYVQVSDSGLPINDPGAVPPATGQIRVGVFAFGNGAHGGVGYAPPPNGGTGAGDVLLDAGSYYQNYALAEGATFDTTYAPNDFRTLILHELGHALGLAHPPYNGTCPVMQPDPACAGIVNRVPDADDVAGAVFLYDRVFGSGFE